MESISMYVFLVYFQSEVNKGYYYGFTTQDPELRLLEHNEGKSLYTKKYQPWKLVWFAGFQTERQAKDFERYLKTPSGHAFSRKRLL
jgi:predicted GIY-YIG superfamily endonuclease